MKVFAGKQYIRRDGTTTDRLVKCRETGFIIDPDTGFAYSDVLEVGNLIFPSSGQTDDCDLMEELK